MENFTATIYFDLEDYAHKGIFENDEPVWTALKKINDYLLSSSLGSIHGKVDSNAYIINPEQVFIGKGTIVEPGAYIQGPCYIGENCQIRHGAYLRGNIIIGSDCVVGHATELKNCIFFDKAQAGHFAYVGDSILGNKVNLGAGTKCANLRFDRENILIRYQGKKIDTGMRKLGAVLGDGVQTGCNSVTNPGTFIGKNIAIAPCVSVNGIIKE